MIKIEDVSFRYKNSENVLENINLEINEGEFISIVGKNGTGKSTILNLLAGLTKPTKGKIFIDDIDTKSKKDFINLRKKVGIVFQNPENQIIFNNVHDDMIFALDNLNLDDKENRIKEALKKVEYPCKEFWKIASEYNIKVLYGIDTHFKRQIPNWKENVRLANEIIGEETKNKLNFIEDM